MNYHCLVFMLFIIVCPTVMFAQQFTNDSSGMNIGSYYKLKANIAYEMQSSYDRSGGNDDGFSGKYSVIRKDGDRSVISEIEGAGTITRIWFPSEPDYPEGPMGLRNKRIYIYLDGNSTPAVDMPVVELFNNSNDRFPYPLCGMGLGGCWCYVPISFNNGVKIMVEGESAKFFQIQYNKYSGKDQLKTFSLQQEPPIPGYRQLAAAIWHPGDISKLTGADAITKTGNYTFKPGNNELPFIKGPAVLRGIIVKASPANLETFLNGTLSITWDDATVPAVNVPLSMFFIQEKGGLNGKSLLAGMLSGGEGVYNFFPMPYHKNSHARINVSGNCKVSITTIFEKPATLSNTAYLHINHVKDYPTTPGKTHVFLDVKGDGHYAGTYLRASGPSLSAVADAKTFYWTGCLEGDEVFEADGKMVEHGTGTEDYFDAGWNGMPLRLDRPGLYPFHGVTLFDAGKNTSSIAVYRWRMPGETVTFKSHFRSSIEVGPQDDIKGNYESISYYYLAAP